MCLLWLFEKKKIVPDVYGRAILELNSSEDLDFSDCFIDKLMQKLRKKKTHFCHFINLPHEPLKALLTTRHIIFMIFIAPQFCHRSVVHLDQSKNHSQFFTGFQPSAFRKIDTRERLDARKFIWQGINIDRVGFHGIVSKDTVGLFYRTPYIIGSSSYGFRRRS